MEHFLSLSKTRLIYETRFVYARTFRNPISTLSFTIWNCITRFEVVSFKMGITLLVWIPFCLKNPYPNTPKRTTQEPCIMLTIPNKQTMICSRFFARLPLPRVDHICKKCFIIISTPLIPLQYVRRDTKKNFSSIGDDLGVPQAMSFLCFFAYIYAKA